MIDGQYGSLIVRDPPSANPHYNLYDEDLPEHVIVISDWMHELSLERYPGRYRNNRGQDPDNYLINGRGNWTDPATGVSTNVPLSMFIVKSGKRYRFRMIDASSTVCFIEVTIEKHSMEIIATDGENVEPVVVDVITMASGERVDFVLHANQTPGYYWLHVRGLGECEESSIYQLAILAYQNSSELSMSPNPGYSGFSGRVFNPSNSTDCGYDVCVTQLQKIYLPGENEVPLRRKANTFLLMSFDFFDYNAQLSLLFNTQNQDYKRFFVSPTGSYLDSLMSNISYQDPPGPLISQNDGYEFMCGDRYTPSTCTEPCSCAHVYNLQKNAIVDIMVYDKEPGPNLNHPFHLHGYSFCVLEAGQFVNASNKDDISSNDVLQVIQVYEQHLQNGDYKACAPKDTMIVPNTGFIIIRFIADNPGWWFFHCHFLWHTATGMNVVLHVGKPTDLPSIPLDFPECYNWTPPN
ncbi:laccase-2 [Ooceraea biroi]|nr:laccase-2 [Ooceraea biroi]